MMPLQSALPFRQHNPTPPHLASKPSTQVTTSTNQSTLHEILVSYAHILASQLRNSDFLPGELGDTIIATNAAIKNSEGTAIMQPDAGICFLGARTPSLVMEACDRASDRAGEYIDKSGGKARVMLLLAAKKRRPRPKANDTLKQSDRITVTVVVLFDGPLGLQRLTFVQDEEVYPRTTDKTFPVAWGLISPEPWFSVCAKLELPCTAEPVCEVGLSPLHDIVGAYAAAGVKGVVRNADDFAPIAGRPMRLLVQLDSRKRKRVGDEEEEEEEEEEEVRSAPSRSGSDDGAEWNFFPEDEEEE